MFQIDTFRLIRKTVKRFLSLTLIVLIGVAFMMGLMSNPYIMRSSVDRFDDKYHLQDLQLYSAYGFCIEDLQALRESEKIDRLFASKTVDVYCTRQDGDELVARVTELGRSVNQIELSAGRMPKKADECVLLVNYIGESDYYLGEEFSLWLDEDIHEYLKNDRYTVVGFVKSPEYICNVFGTSNLKNQELNMVLYVPNTNFIFKYYTTLYMTLKDADTYLSYTREYEDFVDDRSTDIADIAFVQQNYLKDQIKEEAEEELRKATEEFEEKKAEGQAELDEAAQKLNDANIMIVNYEAELDMLNMLIGRLKATVGEDDVSDFSSQAQDFAISHGIDPSVLYSADVREYAKAALDEAQNTYDSLNYQIRKARQEYEAGMEEYKEGVLTFNDEIAKAEAELRKARQDIDDLPKASWTLLNREGHYSSYMYDSTCKQMAAIGYAMPMLFFLVAALVCLTTMTRLVDEQRGQIGIYSALGFTKKQIIGKYVSYAFLAAMIGGILGILLGQAIFPTVIYKTWRLMYDLPQMVLSFPVPYVAICLLSFLGLMCGVTAYVVANTLKDVPASLMRPKAPKNAREILLEKVSFIWEKLSFTSKITARNLFRYKSRFLMTVIGVAGCTALLVLGWGIKDSISDVIDIQFGEIFAYDYQISLENDHHLEENLSILEKDLNNETVVPFMSYTGKLYFNSRNDTASVIVMEPRNAFVTMDLRSADKKLPIKLNNEGIVVSQKFARNNGIKKGDMVILESRNGLKAEVQVSEICEMYFQHYIFMSEAMYQSLFEEEIKDTFIAVKTDDSESLMKDCGELKDFISVIDFSGMIDQFQTMINALDLIIAVIIITSGSLAFVVLVNLTQVNISERVREIATLKVLGFNEHEVNLYIFKEILLLTLIGGTLGLPLGVLEHHFIMNVINMEMVMFGMNISVLSFTYAFLITFIFTAIVLFFMRRPLEQIDMVESLKSVE